MVSLVWGTHALRVYWEVLNQGGTSDLNTQKRLLKAVLPLFKHYRVLVWGDREFHSPKLAEWLDGRGVSFVLRQKKDLHFQAALDQENGVQNSWETLLKKVVLARSSSARASAR